MVEVNGEKRALDKTETIKLRDYQMLLFEKSKGKNSIIYLPTGTGKTMVAITAMYYTLCKEGESRKVVFLANTIQLVKQQAESIKKNLQKNNFCHFFIDVGAKRFFLEVPYIPNP